MRAPLKIVGAIIACARAPYHTPTRTTKPKPTRYLRYHHDSLENIATDVNITAAASLDPLQTSRIFEATIKLRPSLLTRIEIMLSCIAPVEAFAFVEKEGSTYDEVFSF
jgi:hypothetical protein